MKNDVYDDPDDLLYAPFKYRHMGSLAYIGNSAVFDIDNWSFAGGLVAMCESFPFPFVLRARELMGVQISGEESTGASRSRCGRGSSLCSTGSSEASLGGICRE